MVAALHQRLVAQDMLEWCGNTPGLCTRSRHRGSQSADEIGRALPNGAADCLSISSIRMLRLPCVRLCADSRRRRATRWSDLAAVALPRVEFVQWISAPPSTRCSTLGWAICGTLQYTHVQRQLHGILAGQDRADPRTCAEWGIDPICTCTRKALRGWSAQPRRWHRSP